MVERRERKIEEIKEEISKIETMNNEDDSG
jgi:hypothetical protein